mmetsp:Transcript_20067/g.28248  ORF Transcript_20067/g.28248 Transcript_20067/m.28248 type:complete len:87 (+) Transcript_20067:80-340(+)
MTSETISSQISSEEAVAQTMRKGIFQRGTIHVGVGFLAGALSSVILARGGTAGRKVITAFGTGIGIGSAWTRTSMDLEDFLSNTSN